MILEAEYTKEAMVARGRRAAELLDDEILLEAVEMARQSLIRYWLEGKTPAIREDAWSRVTGLDETQDALRRLVADGEHAQMVIAKESR